MITSYRLFKSRHSAQWFDGEGANLFGGRWNSPGTRVLYAAQTLSLAMLEMLVHLGSERLLSAYSYATISFEPASVVEVESLVDLPPDWSASPPPLRVQAIGDAWTRSRSSPVLSVPASMVPNERNYVINVMHTDFEKLPRSAVRRIEIDRRLRPGS